MPPPSLLYGLSCVAHSASQIAYHAARIRASQVGLNAAGPASALVKQTREERDQQRREEDEEADRAIRRPKRILHTRPAEVLKPMVPEVILPASPVPEAPKPLASPEPSLADLTSSALARECEIIPQLAVESSSEPLEATTLHPEPILKEPHRTSTTPPSPIPSPPKQTTIPDDPFTPLVPVIPADSLASTSATPVPSEPLPIDQSDFPEARAGRTLTASKVPSSRIARLFHYGGLAASLSYGAASELVRRSTSSTDSAGAGFGVSSLMLTEANVSRLIDKLTKMRGAALKLGQFLSIQDTHVLPPQVEDIFRRVQDAAHYMPDWQLEQVLTSSLGSNWQSTFTSFTRVPFAAASIGQVHAAVISASASPTGKEEPVAVKVQFPNVADSIASDLGYVKLILTAGRLLPKGLFLDRTLEVMKGELADECDYTREASFLRRFGTPAPAGLGGDVRFRVPWVWEGSTHDVLVMERVRGVGLGSAEVLSLPQEDRDEIATRIIELCLRELFVLNAMQTDPNFSNFLWDARAREVQLVDFGAARAYPRAFIDAWLRLLQAAVSASGEEDVQACVAASRELGYLTAEGREDEEMVKAHVRSMQLLGTPFRADASTKFDFRGPEWTAIVNEIRSLIPTMLQRRLVPPPRESYSLNRKLSGAFLLAGRLGARVDCRKVWEDVVAGYEFGRGEVEVPGDEEARK